jgi:hypothetical protein
MVKLYFVIILSFLTLTSCKAQKKETLQGKKTKVFFLAGQSNMDGRARAYKLSTEDKKRIKEAQKNVTLYYNHRDPVPIQPTKVAKHTAKKFEADTLFGPELFFGVKLSEAYPDHKIVLIKRAKGGMSLYGAWNPDWDEEKATLMNELNAPKLYSDFISYAKSILKEMNSEEYELCGMLWVQGETDSGKRFGTKPAEAYQQNLENLISGVRTEFSKPELPFIIFQVGGGKVVEAMKTIDKEDEFVSLIPQSNDKNSKDYYKRNPPPIGHYVYESMKRIGEQFFEYYQKNYLFK